MPGTLRIRTRRALLAVSQTWRAIRRSFSGDATAKDATLKDEAPASLSTSTPLVSLTEARASFAARYEILEELGRGGMGVVYRARHVDSKRMVALKLVAGSTPEQKNRFLHEAKAAVRLVHPNVVRVHEADIHEGHPFMAMEYVEGESLAAVLQRDGVFAPTELVTLLREVCLGLDAVHRAGLIHRDLKPSNLMLPRDREGGPRIKIVDFGIAIVDDYDAEGSITGAGNLAGTPFYMAPEAYLGHALTTAADIYALGVIAYEMLSGKRPFEPGPGLPHLALQVLHAQPPDLPDSVTRPLRDVVMRALAKDPARRPSSSLAFAEELAREDVSATTGSTLAGR